MRARDIMTTPAVTVTSNTTVAVATAALTEHGFTTLPVVDSLGQLLGLVTEADLVGAGYPLDPRSDGDPGGGVMRGGRARTVGAVMRTTSWAAEADTTVAELAARMTGSGLRSTAVIAGDRVVGMVTFQDVLRALPNNN